MTNIIFIIAMYVAGEKTYKIQGRVVPKDKTYAVKVNCVLKQNSRHLNNVDGLVSWAAVLRWKCIDATAIFLNQGYYFAYKNKKSFYLYLKSTNLTQLHSTYFQLIVCNISFRTSNISCTIYVFNYNVLTFKSQMKK